MLIKQKARNDPQPACISLSASQTNQHQGTMSYEDYARKIAEKAEEARLNEHKTKEQAARRRQAALDVLCPLYAVARSHIMTDLKEHGLVEAIRRHEMRKLALDRAISETL